MNNSDMPAMAVKVAASVQARRQAEGAGLFLEDVTYTGLTKREHFAGLALQGFISAGVNGMPSATDISILAVNYADRLLEMLEE